MSGATVVIDPVIHQQVDLYRNMGAQLEGIASKKFLDDKWFALNEEDALILIDRPLTCLERFWELLARFFSAAFCCTSKYTTLENRVQQIVTNVVDYLAHNDAYRDAFLKDYTLPLNELERACEQMAHAGRISASALSIFQQLHWVEKVHVDREADITTLHNGKGYAPYQAEATIRLVKGMANHDLKAEFIIVNKWGETWLPVDSDLLELPQQTVESSFSTTVDLTQDYSISALMTRHLEPLACYRNQQVDYVIKIDAQCRVTTETILSQNDKNTIRFENNSDKKLTFRLSKHDGSGGYIRTPYEVFAYERLGAQERPDGPYVTFTVTYQTASRPLEMHFNNGVYTCRIDPNGDLRYVESLFLGRV